MADWSLPTLTSTYANFLSYLQARDVDLALQFDGTTSTNLTTNTIRWDSTANRWKKWNGTSWVELTSTYALTGLSTTGAASIGTTLGVTGATTLATATATTPSTADNSTNVATTAYVKAQGYATVASPTFTGTVTIPTGASIAGYLTTTSAASTYAPLASPTFTGTVNGASAAFTTGVNLATSSGRVGIGTTGPLQALQVVGKAIIGNPGQDAPTASVLHLYQASGSDGISWGDSSFSPAAYIGTSAGALNFSARVNSSTAANPASPQMTLVDGRVGINTTSPQKSLDVFGKIQARPIANGLGYSDWFITGTIQETNDFGVGLGIYVENAGGNAYALTFGTKLNSGTAITERMRLDSTGNLGIGCTPSYPLDVAGYMRSSAASQPQLILNSTASGSWKSNIRFQNSGTAKYEIGADTAAAGANNFYFYDAVAAVNRVIIDASGYLKFDSGYGSAATAYGCRAWVNFSGATPTVRANGNVSSVTKSSTGNYVVNFTTAMVDANYCAQTTVDGNWNGVNASTSGVRPGGYLTTSAVSIGTSDANNNAADPTNVMVAIFR
jgi:hypothetical protein